MIETIYNAENSENKTSDMPDVRSGKKPDINIRLPKNIRQIGQSDITMNCQIYIEENVLSYIKKEPEENDRISYGVLLGEKKQGNGYTYIFVNGMIETDDILERTIIFSDDVWTGIYDNMRRYYKNAVIVGWYASTDFDISRDIHTIRKIHLDHFAGNGKVFLNVNREEGEEAFYVYERNGLRKQPCYHVYFEKSYEFEDYLFGTGKRGADEEVKASSAKENGKYGIALNNLKSNQQGVKAEKTTEGGDEEKPKLPDISKFRRVASFATILVLAGVLGFMGKNGQLNAFQDKMESLVGNILDKDEKSTGDIISVNGSLSNNETASQVNAEPQTTTDTQEEITSTTAEVPTSTDEEVTSAEEQTTEKAEATVSLPNENYETYIVKAGETLYSISMAKYGTSDKIKEIVELNKLENENYVREGQKILLP